MILEIYLHLNMDFKNEIFACQEEIKNIRIEKNKYFELLLSSKDSQMKLFLMDQMKALNDEIQAKNDQIKAINDQILIEKEKGF